MSEKRLNIWKWATLLLILCNVVLMAVLWLKPNTDKFPPRETPRDYVVRSLKFTEDQSNRYDGLVKEHQQAMRELRKEAMEYRKLLFANLKNETYGGIFADSITTLIAANQKQIEVVTYDHFRQVRMICTETQKPEFDNIINDVIRRMNGGMHGGPPPHDRRQGPPPGPGGERMPPGGHHGPPPPDAP